MLIDIAENYHSGPVSVAEIASRTGISEKYMEKLIRRLKKAGLVLSKRGPKGGHVLAKPAASITVGDIVRALEEWVVLKGCSLSRDTCASCSRLESCPTKDVWEKANQAMFETLDTYTLQSLLKSLP
jgi:Rrf2 family protein